MCRASLVIAPMSAPAGVRPGRVVRMGLLTPGAAPAPGRPAPLLDAVRDGLRALGYVDGRHPVLEQRHARAVPERFPELAAELTRIPVDLIVTVGSQATGAWPSPPAGCSGPTG
jgi:putative ABC transport system substrate-binding protein